MFFEKPRNFALATDVVISVVMMSQHWSCYVVDRIWCRDIAIKF